MTVFNAEEVKKCLEDVVGEDKEYALWLLEWAINKRSYDLEEYRKQIRAEAIDECIQVIDDVNWIESEHYINLLKQLKEQNK